MEHEIAQKLRQRARELRKFADQLEGSAQLMERLDEFQASPKKHDVSPGQGLSLFEGKHHQTAESVATIEEPLWRVIKKVLASAQEPLTKEEILSRMQAEGYLKMTSAKNLVYPLSRSSLFQHAGKGKWRLATGANPGDAV